MTRLSHPAYFAMNDAKKAGDNVQVWYRCGVTRRVLDGLFTAGAPITRDARVEFDVEVGDVFPAPTGPIADILGVK